MSLFGKLIRSPFKILEIVLVVVEAVDAIKKRIKPEKAEKPKQGDEKK